MGNELWAYENEKGQRWDVLKRIWVDIASGLYSAWRDRELYDFEQTREYNNLPKKGRWVDTNGEWKEPDG